jgi:hypothetical protein
MRIIYSKYIPFKGYVAMLFYNIIFWREDLKDLQKRGTYFSKTYNHESIHFAQMHDFCRFTPIGGTIFYILYFIEWIFKVLFIHPFSHKAYKAVSFEREAYENEYDLFYLTRREKFAWWKRILR